MNPHKGCVAALRLLKIQQSPASCILSITATHRKRTHTVCEQIYGQKQKTPEHTNVRALIVSPQTMQKEKLFAAICGSGRVLPK